MHMIKTCFYRVLGQKEITKYLQVASALSDYSTVWMPEHEINNRAVEAPLEPWPALRVCRVGDRKGHWLQYKLFQLMQGA